MKTIIKKLFKLFVPQQFLRIARGYKLIMRRNPRLSYFKLLLKCHVILPNSRMDYMDDFSRQFRKMAKLISIDTNSQYIYPYDAGCMRMHNRTSISSITVDFGKVLCSDINEIRKRLQNAKDIRFREREMDILDSIEQIANRIYKKLNGNNKARHTTLCEFFPSMLYTKPRSFDEALQKLLFYDALFWQAEHRHIGLGRLDYILYEYYKKDINSGVITKEQAKNMVRDFIRILGKDTVSKSVILIGDTGQYILLGGVDANGQNVDNDLTELFLETLSELRIPDPKIILRVNKDTSDSVWAKSIQCLKTGIGSPLIMGESIIMNKMIRYGYSSGDVWNVGTSACWEPLIIGKSFDQNNPFRNAVAMTPLNQVILQGGSFSSFDDFFSEYKRFYKKELESVVVDMDFDCSPLFSLFFDDCINKGLDFTAGGAVYSHHGVQVVSFPNTINALLNIKRFVFEEKKYTLNDFKNAIEHNYEGMEDLRILLSTTGEKFGSTNKNVISLTNDLIHFTSLTISPLMSNGQSVKVGFSSPAYIDASKDVIASLDGRKAGDPFAVHLSPISSKIDISEIIDFSTALQYDDNCINGNVVDFILPSSYLKQPEKLISILKNACANGLFELQLNVIDKNVLIDAKAHPEKYPNLVVRVWGFSAYFNDLPEDFKDNLIRRAEVYEAA